MIISPAHFFSSVCILKDIEMETSRKRKVCVGESEQLIVELKTRRRLEVIENSGNSACVSCESDRILASCCFSNGSKSLDLEEENEVSNLEVVVTSAGESVESRERRGTNEVESSLVKAKMPSEAELEEFFAVAEKNLQKEFIDKYNFDIVKDEPLPEGRYEWIPVQVKPCVMEKS